MPEESETGRLSADVDMPIVRLFYDGSGGQNRRLEVFLNNAVSGKRQAGHVQIGGVPIEFAVASCVASRVDTMVRMPRMKTSLAAVIPLSLALVGLLTACSTSHPARRPINQSVVEQLESDGMYRTTEVYLSVKPPTRPALQDSSTGATKTRIAAEAPVETERVIGTLEGVNLRELKLSINGHGQRRIPLADIQRIEIKNHTLGLAEGVSGGLLGGVVMGGLFGALNTDYGCTGPSYFRYCPSIEHRMFVFGLSGGIIGGCVGAFLGVLRGHKTTFSF